MTMLTTGRFGAMAAMLAAVSGLYVPASPIVRNSNVKEPKFKTREEYDRYHHNMITSSPAEIEAWNAKVKRRNKRMLTT